MTSVIDTYARSTNPGKAQGGNSSSCYTIRNSHPITSSQREVWFDQLLHGDVPLYNIGGYVRISGSVDPERFERAVNLLVQKHDCLRTILIAGRDEDNVPLQVFAEEMPVQVPLHDFSIQADPQLAALEWMQQRFEDSFALYGEKLFRYYLLKIDPDCFYWLKQYHHLVVDGWTIAMLVRSLGTIYSALEANEEPDLSAPSYLDFIQNDRSYIESAQFHVQRQYWLKKYQNLPEPLFAPRYRSRFVDRIAPSESSALCLPRDLYNRLIEFATANHSTTFHAILGALYVYFTRTAHRDEVVMGLPVLNRANAAFKATGGLFVGVSATYFNFGTDLSFPQLLQAIGQELRQVYRHQRFPVSELNRTVALRHTGRLQIFDLSVSYERHDYDAQFGRAQGQAIPSINGYQQTPLTLFVREFHDEEDVWVHFVYNLAYFERTEIEAIQRRFVNILEFVSNDASTSVETIPLLTEAERQQAISGWNKAIRYPKGACLHERFERQVELTPDAVALLYEGQRLSYADLNCRANRLAHRLRELGVTPDQLVGLRTDRSLEMVIGIIGIFKSGGAYLPLDPAYPKDRVAFMLEDSRVTVLVTQKSLAADLEGIAVTRVLLDEPLPGADTNPASVTTADHLAYVIYTSGSTGKPKGALITHYNITRLFEATDHWYHFDHQDVWTLFHSYAFDFSVWELWGALLYGGRVVIVPYWVSRSPEAFRELLVHERVSVLNQTPSAFRQLIQAELSEPKAELALRYVIFGGEALELQSLRPWFERYGDTRPLLVNMYGITETTVHVTYRPIRREDLESGQGSVIGEPLPDLQVYILDPNGQPVPIGVAGEIYVGGAGVARGYLNRPELTAQRFIPDPFGSTAEATLYRTGDLARRLENGDIEYLGRIDHQVKIRGFRIELGEIEVVIAKHPAIREVVVLAREDAPGDKRLVAYLVAENPPADLVDQLRARIRADMPEYMVPAAFVLLDALPLTENGKVDRKSLPAPGPSRPDKARPYAAPRTPAESAIAQIWGAVLGIDRVSIHDHFFELGGDSILSIQIVARCRQAGLHLTPRDLFKRPTVAQLAEVVAQATAGTTNPQETLTGPVLLTPIEHWFLEQDIAERHHWNQAFLFKLPADVDVTLLEQALHRVVRHHDALRLRLRPAETVWAQEYASDNDPPSIARIDLAGTPAQRRAATIAKHASRVQAGLNLAEGPLLRAVHFALGAEAHGRLLLVIHHLAVDGVSWRLIREDLESAYLSLKAGERPAFAPKTTSYQAWAESLVRFARSTMLHDSASFWIAEANKPVGTLPAEGGDCENLEGDAGSVKIRLTGKETRALLQRVPAAYRTQINDVLLTALGRALQQWTGGDAFRIDMEGHGREDLFDGVDISRTVGWFTTVFPVRLELQAGLDEGQALKSVKEQLRRVPDRGISYGVLRYLCDDAQTRAALSQAPRSALLFNYLGQFDQVVAGSNLLAFATEPTGPLHSPASRRTHTLEVLCLVRAGELEIELIHHPEIHRRETIERVAQDLLAALRAIIAHCLSASGRTPSDFPLAALGQEALDRLRARYPNFEDVYPLTPMQGLFHVMESTRADLGFEQWHFRLDGAIDAKLLRSSMERVVERHSILRTAFVSNEAKEPLQVVLPRVSLPWSEEDWRPLPLADQHERLATLMQSDRRTGFDLAQAPLMRVALRRTADDSYHLLWSTHHLCVDGWSWPLVFREVSKIYQALRRGREPDLDPPCAYRSYVAWLHEEAPDSEVFWKDVLAGFRVPTPLNLAAPPAGLEARAGGFAEESARLDGDITTALQSLAREQHITLNTIVQGAWSLLLSHYSGSLSVVFGAAFSGRPAEVPGIESLVGPCVNNLPVRVTATPSESLLPWLSQLQQRQFELAQHQFAPLEQIQKWAQVPWRYRLFDSLIVFQNYQVDEAARRLGSDAHLVPIAGPEATNYPLTITVTPIDALRLRLIYQRDRLTPDVVRAYAADLTTILRAMAQPPALTTLADLMSRLPQTSRAKAAALAAAKAPDSRSPYVAPTTETEHAVASLWQDLFGVERVSLDDNFFDLGGHSLLLLQAHSRLRATLQPDLPVIALLQYPTIRTLARHLSGAAERTFEPAAAMERARKQREAMLRQRNIKGRR